MGYSKKDNIEQKEQEKILEPNVEGGSIGVSRGMVVWIIFSLSAAAFFSNLIDGLVEASGAYIIQTKNELPIELYALINICAGVMGILASSATQILTSRGVTLVKTFTACMF